MKYRDLMDVATNATNKELSYAWITECSKTSTEFNILNGGDFGEPMVYIPVNTRNHRDSMSFTEQRMFMMFAYWAVRI